MIPEFRLFGGATLLGPDGNPLSGAAVQPRRLAVLAVLAEAWPSAVKRDRVVGLIWPENDDSGGRRLLTQALYVLRREVGPVVRASGQDLGLDPEALRVDLSEFRSALATDPERAASLYRGPVLDGFHLRGALEFERWVDGVREECAREFHRAVEVTAERYAAEGRPREAARWWGRFVAAAPYDAAGVLRLMSAWERAGDPAAALAAAAAYEQRMRQDLELDPDPAVLDHARAVRAVHEAVYLPPLDVAPMLEGPAPVIAGAEPSNTPATPPTRRRRRPAVAAVIALAVALVAAAFVLSPRDPAGGGVMDEDVLRGTNVAPALQAYVEGEAAFRAGRLEEAHSRFSAATVLDSGFTFAWYRRAVAAEWTHRAADADRSIARALRDEERLSERGQLLLRAYSAWRAGDAPAAEAYYRRLLTSDASDLEAWFQFAEIAYHAGPLHGRPLDAARDPWDRVVALDSGNLAALTHAIRLEARAGDTAAIRALSRSLDAIGAEGPVAQESRVTAAYGMGGEEIAAVQPVLDSLPDYSLSFLHGIVASFLEQPAAAVPIARRLTAASRPDAVRGHGHEALAHLALAQGRWREAQAELDRAAQIDRAGAAWTRAYFATLPFLSPSPATIAAAADGLAAAPPAPTTAPLYLELSVEAQAAPVIHGYLAELLRLSGAGSARDPSPADLVLGPDAHPSTRELRLDLQRGLRAEREQRAGRAIRALAELDSMGMRVPYQFAGRSVFFARTRERYLRAELLFRAGRLNEADAAFAAVPHGSRSDYIYLAPVHLRRGQIQERRGDRPAAAAHYRRVLTLLAHPDREFAALHDAAASGLRRVTSPINVR